MTSLYPSGKLNYFKQALMVTNHICERIILPLSLYAIAMVAIKLVAV